MQTRSKRVGPSVAAVVCLALLVVPGAWAAPSEAKTESGGPWTAWSRAVAAVWTGTWEGVVAAWDRVAAGPVSSREVPGGVVALDGETCSEPPGTKHSCSIDPDG